MTIAIRTDASLQIGSGHVMRCLTLANELRQRGAEVLFICREHPGNLIEMIERKGYQVARLPYVQSEYIPQNDDVSHASWLGVSWQQDAEETMALWGAGQPQWLLVDHYALDHRWEVQLRPYVGKIMVIDDLADRPHDCELLLDQNLYGNMEVRYDRLLPESCQQLLGPAYALLRPEFASARQNLRARDGRVRRVLVFFGGVDPSNETQKVLEAVAGLAERQFEVDVVVGTANPNKESIRKYCEAHADFDYHCQVDNMAELMVAADLAIGAGGTTTWERCAVGLPAVVTSVADNQHEIAASACQAGLIRFLGGFSDLTAEKYLKHIANILEDSHLIRFMAEKAMQLVDGNGAGRTANEIVRS